MELKELGEEVAVSVRRPSRVRSGSGDSTFSSKRRRSSTSAGITGTYTPNVDARLHAGSLMAIRNILISSSRRRAFVAHDLGNSRRDVLLCAVSIISILLFVIEEESRWRYGKQYATGVHDIIYDTEGSSSVWEYDILFPLISALLVVIVCSKYMHRLEGRILLWNFTSRSEALCFDGMAWRWIAELLIALIMPIPRWAMKSIVDGPEAFIHNSDDTTTTASWLRHLGLLSFARIYTIMLVLRNANPVYKRRHESYMGATNSSYESRGMMPAVRVWLKRSPLKTLAMTFIFLGSIFMYTIYVIERQARFEGRDVTIESVSSSFWHVFATITTIGYGDIYPSNVRSRLATLACGIVFMVLSPVLVAITFEKLRLKESEEITYLEIEIRAASRAAKRSAATLIQRTWREVVAYRRKTGPYRIQSVEGKLRRSSKSKDAMQQSKVMNRIRPRLLPFLSNFKRGRLSVRKLAARLRGISHGHLTTHDAIDKLEVRVKNVEDNIQRMLQNQQRLMKALDIDSEPTQPKASVRAQNVEFKIPDAIGEKISRDKPAEPASTHGGTSRSRRRSKRASII